MTLYKTIIVAVSIVVLSLAVYFRANCYIEIPAGQKVVIMKSRDVGIGNQLFRFASAYSLAKRLGAKLWIVSRNQGLSSSPQDRGFSLGQFNILYDKFISPHQYSYIKQNIAVVRVDEDNFFSVKADSSQVFIMDGNLSNGKDKSRFESEKFFSDIAADISQITLKEPLQQTDVVKAMQNTESVAVHIRHGDFFELGRVIPIIYQVQAMQEMRKRLPNTQFFIFSDDVNFIRNAFINAKDITVVSQADMGSLTELQLMSQCKHIIIANSTFSWWAAYLIKNPNKVVIAPSFYASFGDLSKQQFYADDFYPKSWMQINPFVLQTGTRG